MTRDRLRTAAMLATTVLVLAGAFALDPAQARSQEVQARTLASDPGESLTMDPTRQQRPELAAVLQKGHEQGLTDQKSLEAWVENNRWSGQRTNLPALDDLNVSELEDLLKQARSSPTPLDETIAKYGSQQDFQDMSWKLAKLYPETYAGMRYRIDDDRVRYYFKGAVPDAVSDLVAGLPEAVVVTGGKYVPRSQQQSLIDHTIAAISPLVKDFSVAFDTGQQEVVVHVPDSQVSRAPDIAAAARAVDQANIVVEPGYTPITKTDSYMRGGGILTWGNSVASLGCTAGFVLESNGSGAKRLGTAGHCIQEANQFGLTSGRYQLQFIDGAGFTTVDNLWWINNTNTPDLGYTSYGGFTPIGVFYAEPGVKRSVQGEAHSRYDEGTSVCFYGVATNNGGSCGVITNAALSQSCAGCYGLVETSSSAIPIEGDSGGPWYRGNWAVGQTVGNDEYPGHPATHGYYQPVFMYDDYNFHVLLY